MFRKKSKLLYALKYGSLTCIWLENDLTWKCDGRKKNVQFSGYINFLKCIGIHKNKNSYCIQTEFSRPKLNSSCYTDRHPHLAILTVSWWVKIIILWRSIIKRNVRGCREPLNCLEHMSCRLYPDYCYTGLEHAKTETDIIKAISWGCRALWYLVI